MEQQYRVYDDRKREETLFAGTHQQAMRFINENYILNVYTNVYLHIWIEKVK